MIQLRRRLRASAFLQEGTMVAFPTCFPGVTVPLAGDESHITALDVTDKGVVYAGAGGRACHVLVAAFGHCTGIVFDMGVVEGANHCAAICCGKKKLIAAVNGPAGGRLVAQNLLHGHWGLIQEWGFERSPYDDLGSPAGTERIGHAITDAARDKVVGVTEQHLFTVDIESGRIDLVAEVPGAARLARGSQGRIFGPDGDDSLWCYDPADGTLERRAVQLPAGSWNHGPLMWAAGDPDGRLYTADAEGNLFAFTEPNGFEGPLGRTPLAPAGPMAVTRDGRLFGAAGSEIARMFCYDPRAGSVSDLGVAVSVLERRRYGYVFGDAVTGRDGQIIFGEDDDLGHVWLYFPSIQPRSK